MPHLPGTFPTGFSLGASYLFPGEHMSNAIASRALGGWTLSGLVVLQSGYPFTVYSGAPLSVNTTAADGTALTSTNYAAELAAGNLLFASGSGDFNADGDNNDYPSVTGYQQKHSRKDYQVDTGSFPLAPVVYYRADSLFCPGSARREMRRHISFVIPDMPTPTFRSRK